MGRSGLEQASAVAALYIEAVRRGETIRFRVASNSMNPWVHRDDEVEIAPATARAIPIGDIAAFETRAGLVIHRILARRATDTSVQLLQMSDVDIHPSWVEEEAVIGHVITCRHRGKRIDLQHTRALTAGASIARARYLLSTHLHPRPLRVILRLYSYLTIYIGYWYIRLSH